MAARLTKPDLGNGLSHPARFSTALIPVLARMLSGATTVLDPFAGTGRIHELRRWGYETTGVELEPEWARLHPDTIVGDATALPSVWSGAFDAVCTSPCLAQHHRVLTDDLRWVPVGDIVAGDALLTFDENGSPTARGTAARRRWQRAEVVRSEPKTVDCVRVILSNGDEVITTPEHPWLTFRYTYGGHGAEWMPSKNLLGVSPDGGIGAGRGWKRGRRQPYCVLKQLEPWVPLTSYEAGWLAGLFDGEGSLSLGGHGAPKLVMYQVQGPVIDRAEEWLTRLGYQTNQIVRKPHEKWQPAHRQPVVNLYVAGGFPGLLRALGELRPARLLEKWSTLDVSSRTVEAERVAVLAIEPAGRYDIQEIETTSGTYIGEGYLMHNCYGNRLSDHHDAKDGSLRRSYRFDLGRPLSDNNSGALQWGPVYRQLHEHAWREARRVVRPGGRLVLNVKDHIRAERRQYVSGWHVTALCRAGFTLLEHVEVETRGLRLGANADRRLPGESVYLFELGLSGAPLG